MKILITGGAGFIGSHLAEALIKRGHAVIIVDNLMFGTKSNLPKNARLYRVNYGNALAIQRIFRKEKPEAVFHLAARISVRESERQPLLYVKQDLLGSMRLIDLAKQFGVRKFVFASTGGVMYGEMETLPLTETTLPRPSSPYAMSKLFTEAYLFASGMPAVALRYANVYGPRQNPRSEAGVVAIFSECMARGEQPIIYNHGTTTRDYVFVSDVVSANIAALENDCVCGVYNIGTGRETSVNEIFALLNKHFGMAFAPRYAEAPVAEIHRSALSSEVFQVVSGWRPTVSLEEGVQRVAEYCKRQPIVTYKPLWRFPKLAYILSSFL